MRKHNFDPAILREYDIRGQWLTNLHLDDAYYLGRSLAVYVNTLKLPKRVCVGRDGRLSSPILLKRLTSGLLESGIEVIDLGLIPTPTLYFANFVLPDIGAAVEVTGSHNPIEYNGFKIVVGKKAIFSAQIKELGKIASKGLWSEGTGKYQRQSVMSAYLAELQRHISSSNALNLKVAWDPGNGVTAEVIQKLTKIIPGKHIIINGEVDGNFPNHHPDPTVPSNMGQLKLAVSEHNCNLGIGFDGDGDRIGIVDELGNITTSEQLLLIFAKDLLTRNPKAKIIADIKTSKAVFETINSYGGTAIMWKTGHSLIKQKMSETGALLAAEVSGHIYFGEFGFDDAMLAACKLIEIVAKKKYPLSEIANELPKIISSPELRLECEEVHNLDLIKDIAKELPTDPKSSISQLDGLRVDSDTYWFLLRASNTQNMIVIRAGATNFTELNLILNKIKCALTKIKPRINLRELDVYLAQIS